MKLTPGEYKHNNDVVKAAVERFKRWQQSPFPFIKDLWGLTPQPLNCAREHTHVLTCFSPFQKGKHITWQQTEVLRAVERAIQGTAPKRISVVTGHGIGKTAVLAWLVHWYLATRYNAQIGCTAPTSDQMYDVLWKELEVWHQKLKSGMKEKYEWSTTHFKITEQPNTWWARARTARKETPEALAGLHGPAVGLFADEASGIPDEIFRAGEGSLTNKDVLVILFSNGTRLTGFFYDTHHKDRENWQTLSFSSVESPIVEQGFCDRIKAKYGESSDEYRFMVMGLFPNEQGVEEGGWLPLISEADIRYCPDVGVFRNPRLGYDPAGSGSNKSVHVIRDDFKAKVVAVENISTRKSRAEHTLSLITHYRIPHERVAVDNFGEGANVGMDIAIADGKAIKAVNVGHPADDKTRYIDKRAEDAWRAREWLISGGQVVHNQAWKQLLVHRYRRTMTGKIQLMSKEEMRKRGLLAQSESPDAADAFFLTFEGDASTPRRREMNRGLGADQRDRIAKLY